jgi:hypothetical protein
MATATSSAISVGTLILDMYDPATKQLVWTGRAKKTINPGNSQEKMRKNLDKAMQKLLKNRHSWPKNLHGFWRMRSGSCSPFGCPRHCYFPDPLTRKTCRRIQNRPFAFVPPRIRGSPFSTLTQVALLMVALARPRWRRVCAAISTRP